jgi:hypothetical protein
MNLSAYNTASYSSAIEASEQGGLYNILTLNDINTQITLEELNDDGNMRMCEIHRAWECAVNTANLMEHEAVIKAVLTDGKTPKFEMLE